MTREIVDTALKQQVFEKYHNKCYVCGSRISIILRVHHIIPVSLGGKDAIDNLVLLCPNCHTLVHIFSAKRFEGKDMVSYLMAEYQSEAIERIAILVEKIRGKKQRVEQEGNIWPANDANTQRPYTIDEAIESVALQNKYTDEQQRQLAKVFHITLDRIPQEIKEKCSYRLLKRGCYISINLMNYLLYRSPGYGDLGGKPYYECFLIFTKDLPSHFETTGERNVFSFSHFDCVNLGLSFEEVLSLSDMEWDNFGQACQMASKARKSRSWVSNIQI